MLEFWRHNLCPSSNYCQKASTSNPKTNLSNLLPMPFTNSDSLFVPVLPVQPQGLRMAPRGTL